MVAFRRLWDGRVEHHLVWTEIHAREVREHYIDDRHVSSHRSMGSLRGRHAVMRVVRFTVSVNAAASTTNVSDNVIQVRRRKVKVRSDSALSHPKTAAIEMRWKISPFATRRGAPPKAAPNRPKLPTITRLDAAE